MFSTTWRIPRCSASIRPRRSASSDESRSGMRSPTTRSFPSARVQSAATTELSMPPDMPTTAPRRRRTWRTCSRIGALDPLGLARRIEPAARLSRTCSPSYPGDEYRTTRIAFRRSHRNGGTRNSRIGARLSIDYALMTRRTTGTSARKHQWNPRFLHDWVFATPHRRPGAPAVASPSARLTYGELAERVRALAGLLSAAGVGPGATGGAGAAEPPGHGRGGAGPQRARRRRPSR